MVVHASEFTESKSLLKLGDKHWNNTVAHHMESGATMIFPAVPFLKDEIQESQDSFDGWVSDDEEMLSV